MGSVFAPFLKMGVTYAYVGVYQIGYEISAQLDIIYVTGLRKQTILSHFVFQEIPF